jgi:polar amino acid transport system substrate-binding protein
VTNAVVLGQADAMSADSPVKKGSPLAQSLQQALEHLIASGDYKTIVTNWGLEAGAIDKPVINGAIN